jgi:1,4-dihydroxy-2-naphthoyl-CoA hydrolase
MIWFTNFSLDKIKEVMETNMVSHLGIKITELGSDYIEGIMPVDYRTQQPLNILHGGASVVLAESLGSIAANLVIDPNEKLAIGLDVNASHIKPVRNGLVKGRAYPIHIGRTTQVWQIDIKNSADAMVCTCKLSMSVLDKGNKSNAFSALLDS